jgi:hypothetical protein
MEKLLKKKPMKARAAKKDFSDLTALIRSIQRAEGNPDCFRRSPGYCDQLDCVWRKYCLEEFKKHLHDELEPQRKENQPTSKGARSEGKNP